jgi:Flp pilus assembly protein TadB
MPETNDQRDITPAISENMKNHYEYFNVRRRKMGLFAGIKEDLRTAKFDASDFQFSAIFRRMFQTLIFSFVAYILAAVFLVLKFNYQISVFLGFATVFGVCAVFLAKRKKRRFNGREY